MRSVYRVKPANSYIVRQELGLGMSGYCLWKRSAMHVVLGPPVETGDSTLDREE
jgi:hypothetical protein